MISTGGGLSTQQPFSRGDNVLVLCEYDYEFQGQPAWRAPDGTLIANTDQGMSYNMSLSHIKCSKDKLVLSIVPSCVLYR